MVKRIFATGAVFLLSLSSFAAEATKFVSLGDGDRVVFYGDSITEQKLYTRYIQQYIYCRYPDLKVQFFNAGWSGDRAIRAADRLDRDVLSLRPTVVTLFFGMNDGNYRPLDETAIREYRTGMEGIVKKLTDAKVRVIVFSPGCVDYDKRDNLRPIDYNGVLNSLGLIGREVAEKYNCAFLDVHTPMLAYQAARKAKDPQFSMIPDAIHPNNVGHLVMAHIMLPALAEPMRTLQVDADDAMKGAGAKFAAGVPFWVEPNARETARLSGMDDFTAQRIVVKKLPPGYYQLTTSDKAAARGTAEQFAEGVAISSDSPAGKRLHDLTAMKETAYFFAWREIRLPMGDVPEAKAVNESLLAADAAYDKALHAIATAKTGDKTVKLVLLPEGENLAAGKPVESSDPNRYGWAGSGLTDGLFEPAAGRTYASGNTDAFPKTATIDLGASSPVAKVMVAVPNVGSTKTVIVSLSEDGTTFEEIGSYAFTLGKEERHTYEFPTTAARYVRLTYPDHATETAGNFSPNFVFTSEVEVYGAAKK